MDILEHTGKMKKLLATLRRLLGSSKGFTLIELLVVIAVLGVLAAGVLVAVDPVDKINAANDSKVQADISALASASEAYAASHNGLYAISASDLQDAGEIKTTPTAPSGYSAYVITVPNDCTTSGTDPDCTSVIVTGQLKSKKYTTPATPVQKYESSSGKTCQVDAAATACP